MAWPCFLFLCQLFLSTGLTGSPLDNSAFLLPGWASCFHCMEFSNQELVPPVSQQALLLLYRGGTIQLSRKHPSPLLPFIRAKHTERVYVHVLMYQQNKVLITFRHGLEGHTHTHAHWPVRETDEISNTVHALFVGDHLFLPVLLFGFSLKSISADYSLPKHTGHIQRHFLYTAA